mgnify:CR=1 FL=1
MKIGAVGLGNRIAHVFHELSQINQEAKLISYVDPLPIGKDYAEKHNFFPKKIVTFPLKSKNFQEFFSLLFEKDF